jgi:predicted alpha-1,6-mannanase (GH76 family)
VVRACGKPGNLPDTVCTDWVGQEKPPSPGPPARRAVEALMDFYDADTGLFATTGWWNNANALTAVIDYAQATGDDRFDWVIANTYEKNIDGHYGNFTNEYIDDTGWWSLAWIRAYDYTGEQRYLEMAKTTADYMWSYRDDVCGGGLWWRTDKTYKNAVTNELFIKAAAELHNRIPDDTAYLEKAVEVWEWFDASGMINDESMINDGLVLETCESNGQTTWTYNQGIILGGLTALHEATGDKAYLRRASELADASIQDELINPDGVLTEPCEPDCGGDGPTFKGVYVRNLAELADATNNRDYLRYLKRQAKTAWHQDRNAYNQYGVSWAGPLTGISAATQTSAFEALTAPIRAIR